MNRRITGRAGAGSGNPVKPQAVDSAFVVDTRDRDVTVRFRNIACPGALPKKLRVTGPGVIAAAMAGRQQKRVRLVAAGRT